MPSAFDTFLPGPSARVPSPFDNPAFPDGQDESTFLGNLQEAGLGGLAYLGKVADKTFGGRAIRGLLTGNVREAFSVLPFSDTIGITDERQVVHGEDLLRQWGALDPNDNTFFGRTLPGIATELALDPAMYFGAAVPKAVFGGLGMAGRGVGRGIGAATGFDPVAAGTRFATDTVLPPIRAAFDPLVHGSTMGAVQRQVAPTFDNTLTTGNNAAEHAYYGATVDLSPFAKMFPDAQALIDRAGTQAIELGPDVGRSTLLTGGLGNGRLAGGTFTPEQADEILRIAGAYGARGQQTRAAELARGLASRDLVDMPDWQIAYNESLNQFKNTPGAGSVLAPGHATDLAPWQHEMAFNRAKYGRPEEFAPVADYLPASLNPYDGAGGWARTPRREMGTGSEFQMKRDDIWRGLRGGRARANELSADPRLSGLGRTFSEDEAVKFLAEELGGGLPLGAIPLSSPVYEQARDMARVLGGLRPDAREAGIFNLDFAGNIKARELDSARRLASADAVMATARPAGASGGFIKDVAAFEAERVPYVRVPEFLEKMGLTATDASTGNPQAAETVAQLLGINTSVRGWQRDLAGYAIPTDVAKDVARMGAAWNVPEALAPIVATWDASTNMFKGGITAPFPAFHGRNLMSGLFNMWRDGVPMTDVFRYGRDMMRMQRGGSLSPEVAARLFPGRNLSPEAATQEFLKELMANRISFVRNTQVADQVGGPAVKWGIKAEAIPDVGGAVRPFYDDAAALGRKARGFNGGETNWNPFDQAGVFGRTETKFAPVAAGQSLGNAVEDWLRGTHYMSRRMGGSQSPDAKLAVMKYQIDYSAMTEFERQVMKRMFPFYAFSRRNLPPMLEDLATKPAKLAGALRVATGTRTEGEFVPPWVAEGSSVRVPGAPEGKDRFVSSFGLPFEDEGLKTLGALAQGDFRRVFQQGFGMAQPLIKLPAEVATGTQMYSGRPLASLDPYDFTRLGGLLQDDTARLLSQTLSNTPLSRTASTLNRFTDGRENLATDMLSLAVGSRITDVDTAKAREQAAMQLLRERLRGQPGIRVSENLYVRPEDLPKVQPEDRTLYGLLRQLQAQGAARAREAGR
jgi:hypothetical protein